jgi:hypothetical protein
MHPTAAGAIRASGIAAIVAGLMFVIIQPLHPADVLGSVRTDAWAYIHYASLLMLALFVVGIVGIWARQVEQAGWLGVIGVIVLAVGLVLTAVGTVIEAFVSPLLVDSDPAFVNGLLGMVEGRPTDADLGVIPVIWSVSSTGFLLGTLTFGIATWRANVLSRWAAAVFGVGLLASAPIVGILGMPRLAAVPVGLGLAWLGYSLWSERRSPLPAPLPEAATPQPDVVPAS